MSYPDPLSLWRSALNSYVYKTDLTKSRYKKIYPAYFCCSTSDYKSVEHLQNRFRHLCSSVPEVWYEVIYWKTLTLGQPDRRINDVHTFLDVSKVFAALKEFIKEPSPIKFTNFRTALGYKKGSQAFAVPMTFPAFYAPDLFPMVDKYVAKWVNASLKSVSSIRSDPGPNKLMPFKKVAAKTELNFKDHYCSYIAWVNWCRRESDILNVKTCEKDWTPRRVEMAVFAATHNPGITLDMA